MAHIRLIDRHAGTKTLLRKRRRAAAHDVLASLYPTRLAVFDAELVTSLDGIEKIGSGKAQRRRNCRGENVGGTR